MLRQPAVAGQFYPGSQQQLKAMLNQFLATQAEPRPAILAVCPHAGYVYSGATAGKVLGQVVVPRRVVVVGPNHRGMGHPAAVMSRGQWLTPLGRVELDAEMGADLLARCPVLAEDPQAHLLEHSLEVQVPFLQARQPSLSLLAISLSFLSYADCQRIGQALGQTIAAAGEPVLMVASTDMTHYESAEMARKKDTLALERLLALDPQGLFDTVRGLGLSRREGATGPGMGRARAST